MGLPHFAMFCVPARSVELEGGAGGRSNSLMKNVPGVLFVALTMITVGGRAENVREEASRLIAEDVKSGGKSVPKGPKPVIVPKSAERKMYDEGDPEILVLPKVEVTAPKITPFEKK